MLCSGQMPSGLWQCPAVNAFRYTDSPIQQFFLFEIITMASYDFLTLASTGTVPTQVFLTLDTLTFGGSIRAADLTINTANGATTISYTNGGTTVSLKLVGSTAASGFLNTQIAPANFIFSDGSKLMIGDGTTSTATDSMNNTLIGTEYNDYMDGAGGIDTVSYATAAYGVTVDLSTTVGTTDGAAGNDKLLNMDNIIGSAYNDVLIGSATVGSTIDGGFGADIMKGGTGNDTFYVTAGDTVTDSGGTADTIITSVDYYTLPTNIENLVLVSGTYATGNSSANTMTGNTGNNTLDGSTGADTLIGGLGNDTYVVDNAGDVVSELSGQGTDLIISSVSITALAANVENLQLAYGTAAINGTGNELDNIIYANKGNNVLDGGTNTSVGDTLSYRYGATSGVIANLSTGAVTGGSGTDTVTNFENLTGSIYNDTLTGGSGVNVIDGGAGNDTLIGGTGADRLIGGLGDDTYVLENTSDTVTELGGQGSDTIQTNVSYSIANLLNIENITLTGSGGITATGNSLANILRGQSSGINTLTGGTGNDSYYVSKQTDVINEFAGGGTDTVFASGNYSIANASNLENLTMIAAGFTGTGNSGINTLTANATGGDILLGMESNDKLYGGAGNDTLDGGTGSDTMVGGKGNDSYFVDSVADVVTENLNEGTDTVTLTSNIAYTLASNVENLILGAAVLTTSALGNTLNNTITGNDSNNVIDGSIGADAMFGGLGDDSYYVDNIGDTVTEAASAGTDTVYSTAISFTLGANVENLVLNGSNGISGTGNTLNNNLNGNTGGNVLSGLDGNDIIDGGLGADTLIGGLGNDTYYVDNIADTVSELSGQGTDTVISTATYALNDVASIGVENLTLMGSNNISGSGNSLANTIIGNSASNILDGNGGKDTLTGGGGKDYFTFTGLTETNTTSTLTDVITDFKQSDKDIIDLTVDFGGVTPTLLTTRGAAFANSAVGELRYVTSGSDTVIYGHTAGDTGVDFSIVLTGNTSTVFALSDFKFS